MCRSEMNATSMVTRLTAMRNIVCRQRTSVHAFADDDARIVAEPPVELIVADVERDDALGAAPEQHVGEAAGGRADVERAATAWIDGERIERVRELHAAAADVGVIGHGKLVTRASSATGAPAFDTTWPSTDTCPARISARARSRVGARPRSTSATSRRTFTCRTWPFRPAFKLLKGPPYIWPATHRVSFFFR